MTPRAEVRICNCIVLLDDIHSIIILFPEQVTFSEGLLEAAALAARSLARPVARAVALIRNDTGARLW